MIYITAVNVGAPFVYAQTSSDNSQASSSAESNSGKEQIQIDVEELEAVLTEPSKTPEEEIKKVKAVSTEHENVLDLDTPSSFQESASFFKSAVIQKLKRKAFRMDESIPVTVFNAHNSQVSIRVKNKRGQDIPVQVIEQLNGSTKHLDVVPPSSITPGIYTIDIVDSSGVTSTQNFTWGVLAFNTNKAVYKSNETAHISIAVLDDLGHMVCDAEVVLLITDPSGTERKLSTQERSIRKNPECHIKDFTQAPDFATEYEVSGEGVYMIALSAVTTNGAYAITDSFSVNDDMDFDVERKGPTRIYPVREYPVEIAITAVKDFKGLVTDVVPSGFEISEHPTAQKYVKVGMESDRLLVDESVLGVQAQIPLPFENNHEITAGFGEVHSDPTIQQKYEQYDVEGHDGVDFDMPVGTKVLSVDEGMVVRAQENDDYGTTITIEHSWGKSYYGHLSKMLVSEGDRVKRGENIALSGNTGVSTNPHLHFAIKPADHDKNNGFFGKVDPLPYLGMKDAKDVLALTTKNDFSVQVISWEVDMKKGETITLGYVFDAPDESPQFYTLGPLHMFDATEKMVLSESRRWQIASDALLTRSQTVQFNIGTYTTNGTAGLAFNAEHTLPDGSEFEFRLAESGVVIQDAFIDWTVHFNSIGTATQLNSLFTHFDLCTDPCTPDAWNGIGTSSATSTTDYLSNSGEANVANFKMEVTDEAQLASYTGGGTMMSGQFGFCLGTTTTCTGAGAVANGISYVTGRLFVTYTYSVSSTEITNSVIYPLESTVAGDSGSRRASQASGCTLGTNCPVFNYNMTVPELDTRYSQWFTLDGSLDATNTADHITTARIGSNTATGNQVFDQAKSGNDAGFRFQVSNLAGYSENSSQTLSRSGQNGTVYTMGGEVFETYSAPVNATTKTRTIRIPLGEICATQVTTKCTVSPSISFPEGGVDVIKAWTRFSYSTAAASGTTLTAFSKVGSNTESSRAYSIAPGNAALVISSLDYIYDVIPSSNYALLETATPTSPVTVDISTQYTAARGATSGELLITYTYTDENSGYNVSQTLFAGNSDTDNNKDTWSSQADLIDPVIPDELFATVKRAGLFASYFSMDSDGSNPADHGGTANTVMSMGANIAVGTCTSTNTSIPDTSTEANAVDYYKDVTALVTESDTATYTSCYSDRSFVADTTAGFQVSGALIIWYQTDLVPILDQIHSRWRDDDGSETTATWRRAEDVSTTAVATGVRRLRVEVSNQGAVPANNITYRLEFGLKSTTCSAIGSWTMVPTTATTEPFQMFNSTHFTDGSATTNIGNGLTDENATFVAGQMKDTGSQTSGITLSETQFTEIEYAIQVTNNVTVTQEYCFRLTHAGSTTDFAYSHYPELSIGEPSITQNHYRWRNDNGVERALSGQSVVMHPTGQGVHTGFGATGCTDDTDEWDCVNDQPGNAGTGAPEANDGLTTNLAITGANGTRSSFTLDDGVFPLGTTVTEMVITTVVRETATGGTNPQYRQFYRLNGSDTDCSTNSTIGVATFTVQTCTFSSLSLTEEDMDAMEIGVVMMNAFDLTVSQVYVTVTYDVVGASWKRAEDTVHIGQMVNENIRLRIGLANTALVSANRNLRLEYAPKVGGACGDDETFIAMPITASTEDFEMETSPYFNNGDFTTSHLTPTGSFDQGRLVSDPSNSTGAGNVMIQGGNYTEVEYVFQAVSTASGSYCFQLTDSGSALNTYDVYPEIRIDEPHIVQNHFRWRNDNGPQTTLSGQSVVMHPTGQGVHTGFGATGCTDDTDEWDCVNDQPGNAGTGVPEANDGLTTNLDITGANGTRSSFTLDDGVFPLGTTVTEMVITTVVRETTTSGTNPQFRQFYRLNGSDTNCSTNSSIGSATFTVRECTFSSLSLTEEDMDAMEIGVVMMNAFDLTVSQVYVTVTYDIAPAQWKAEEDAHLIGQEVGQSVRLRFSIANTSDVVVNRSLRLEYAPKVGSVCGDNEVFAVVPVNTSSEPFDMALPNYFTDGEVIATSQLTSTGDFAPGRMVADPSNSSEDIEIQDWGYTEVEYAFAVRDIASGGYCFRVTDEGSLLDDYTLYPELVIPMLSELMRNGKWMYDGVEQPFTF